MQTKASKSFTLVMILILSVAFILWLFWPNIEDMLFESEYNHVNIPTQILPTIDGKLKTSVLDDLEELRQYGQWPLVGIRENSGRRNPFDTNF